jgi:hypothetical protein
MEMRKVSSTTISYVGYDSNTMELTVEFHTGAIYVYEGVEESVYQDLMWATSIGQYFSTYIKNRYPYKKIDIV